MIHVPSIRELPYPDDLPLRWQDEQSGMLPAAVRAFSVRGTGTRGLSPEQVTAIIAYCRYYIHAPCWREDADGALSALRRDVEAISDVVTLDAFLGRCLAYGIDPL